MTILSEFAEMIQFLYRRAICRHEWKFSHNLYGDQIVEAGYNRSLWICSKCNSATCRGELHG